MEARTTPEGGETSLKRGRVGSDVVEPTRADIARAESVLRSASHTAGLAAYQYFFIDASLDAKEAYLSAIEAESEAAAIVALLRGHE